LAFFFAGCTSVAGTGRSQLSLVNEAQLNQQAALAYSQYMSEAKLSTNRAQTAMVKRVGERIAKAAKVFMASEGREAEIANYQWEYNLVQNDEPNAFCMPGGKIVVNTGILPVCENEAGLATVVGHEVAHALAKHGLERASQETLASLGGTLLNIGLGAAGVSGQTTQIAMTAYGLGAQFGVLLPYSRSHESEADRIGLSLMALAGYDPHQALAFWNRFSQVEGASSQGTSFFSTHPTNAERIKNINVYIDEAIAKAKTANVKFTN
jgi:predicted Zn-dependent protease